MLRIHHFPTQWKCAVISMIPKPGKPENLVASYRPISQLPTFSKIFERIFLSRMMAVRSVQDAIPDDQFGFRSHHGTPEQAHRVTQYILGAFENKQYSSAVFLDVKEAFDRVWHDGLLFKLKTLQPTAQYLLLKSYLLERNFMVDVRGEMHSDAFELSYLRVAFLVRFCTLYLPLTCRVPSEPREPGNLMLMILPSLPTLRVELKRLESLKTFWTCMANGRIDGTFR